MPKVKTKIKIKSSRNFLKSGFFNLNANIFCLEKGISRKGKRKIAKIAIHLEDKSKPKERPKKMAFLREGARQ